MLMSLKLCVNNLIYYNNYNSIQLYNNTRDYAIFCVNCSLTTL